MLNINASATMTLLNPFICKEIANDNLIAIFYGAKTMNIDSQANANETATQKVTKKSNLNTKLSENFIQKCFIILTQKRILIYKEDLMDLLEAIEIIKIIDIQQDCNNNSYMEIIYSTTYNDKNEVRKIEIALENKNYFFEKCVENFVYEKTDEKDELVFFNLSQEKIDFKAKYAGGSNKSLECLVNHTFGDTLSKFEEYTDDELLTFIKLQSEQDEKIKNSEVSKGKTKKRTCRIQTVCEVNANEIGSPSGINLSRMIYRYKKHYFFIPYVEKGFSKVSNDLLLIKNPFNEKYPIRLILGSSVTMPLEMLDFDSDALYLRDSAHMAFGNIVEVLNGKTSFLITKSEEINFKKKEIICDDDYSKYTTWLLEAKTKVKKRSYYNIVMIYIRKSFYPPYFDTYKDFFFTVIEKNKISLRENILEDLGVNHEYSKNNTNNNEANKSLIPESEYDDADLELRKKIFMQEAQQVKTNLIVGAGRHPIYSQDSDAFINNKNESNFINQNYDSHQNKSIKMNNSNLNLTKGSKAEKPATESQSVEYITNEEGKIIKKIIKKKILVKSNKGNSGINNSINDNNDNNVSINNYNNNILSQSIKDMSNLKLNSLNAQELNESKNMKIKTIKTTIKKKKNFNSSKFAEEADETNNNNSKEFDQTKRNDNSLYQGYNDIEKIEIMRRDLSLFGRTIIKEIGESFCSMLNYDKKHYEKMETLAIMRIEAFSCFRAYYEFMFPKFCETKNLLFLYKFSIDLLLKVLLILKESSLDDVSGYMSVLDEILLKYSNDPDFILFHKEKISNKDFSKILEENEGFFNDIFLGYYKQDIEPKQGIKSKNFNKLKENQAKLVVNNSSVSSSKNVKMTNTRKFLNERRNDFIIFCLEGKFLKNIDLNLEKIVKLSYRKETTKSYVKNLIFPLLNIENTLDSDSRSPKDLLDNICQLKEENIKVTFNEDVMAALIKCDFFRKNNIIIKSSEYENFIKYILEHYPSNKIIQAFYYCLKEEKLNTINYEFLVQTNFNKKDYKSKFNNPDTYKPNSAYDFNTKNMNNSAIETINPNKSLGKSIYNYKDNNNNYTNRIYKENVIFAAEQYNDLSRGEDIYETTDLNKKNADKKNNNQKTKNVNIYNFAIVVEGDFQIDLYTEKKNDDLKKKLDSSNFTSVKVCSLLFKYFSNYKGNFSKIILSCKCLILLCKGDSTNRKVLFEKKIFNVIYKHFYSFSDEHVLISTLKLYNVFLSSQDKMIKEFIYADDKYDEHIMYLISLVLSWNSQGIKTSAKIIISLLDILKNTFIILSSKGLSSNDNNKQGSYSKQESQKLKSVDFEEDEAYPFEDLNITKKLEFMEILFDEKFIMHFLKEKDLFIEIYEKNLLLILTSCKMRFELIPRSRLKILIKKIENKFEKILNSFENYLMTFDYTTIGNTRKHVDYESKEEENFIHNCKLYFITWSFFDNLFYEKELKKKINVPESPMRRILLLIDIAEIHPNFKFLYEKSLDKIKMLKNKEAELEFQSKREILVKKMFGEL